MNDIMSKYLLVGDKFMCKMYLTIMRGKNYMNKLMQEFVKINPCLLPIIGYTTK